MVALLGAMGAGCATYKDDISKLCDAPARSGASAHPEFSPADRATVAAAWADGNLSTSEGKALLHSLPSLSPPERAQKLRDAAKTQGLDRCDFADIFATPAK